MKSPTGERMRKVIYKLDERLDAQLLRFGADSQAAVKIVDRYHSVASMLETRFPETGDYAPEFVVTGLRQLRYLVRHHASVAGF